MSSPFHLRCMYQVSIQTGRTHTRDSWNSWNSRTQEGKHLPVVRGLALRIRKYTGDDAQGQGGLSHRMCLGTLRWGHWGMVWFGSGLERTQSPAQGRVLLRRHLTEMGEVKAAAPVRSWECGNVSLSKRLCWPEMLLHYSALRNIFHLRTDTSLKPV